MSCLVVRRPRGNPGAIKKGEFMRATLNIDEKLWLDWRQWCQINKKNIHGETEALIRTFLIKDEKQNNENN